MLRLEGNMKLFSRRDLTLSLIRARKEAGLTQAELSEKTGISQADISKIRCVNLF
jgi:toxin-antitoxin system, antitoxin component, xre family